MKSRRFFILTTLVSLTMTTFLYGYHFYLIWISENLYFLGGKAVFLINIAPVFFGILLGSYQLLSQSNKTFSINWTKLTIQGIPAFIIGFPYFFRLFGIEPLTISTTKISVPNLAGVWLGFVIISSLYKENQL